MKTMLLNCVIHAAHYEELINWYMEVFNLEIIDQFNDGYHYTDLGCDDEIIFGITKMEESKETFPKPHANATLPQVIVSDIEVFMQNLAKQKKGGLVFGPVDENGFVYAIASDSEENKIWVVEEHKG